MLNEYRDMCLDIIKSLDSFHISHIPRDKNKEANILAQPASGSEVTKGMFMIKRKPT
jgi:hypothetical protein